MTDLKDLKGVNRSTAKKLTEAGYTLENILDDTSEEITEKTGLSEKIVTNILLEINKLTVTPGAVTTCDDGELALEVNVESKDETVDFDLEKENKYLVAGFKASKLYKKELTGRELKEAFQKYKKKGAEIK